MAIICKSMFLYFYVQIVQFSFVTAKDLIVCHWTKLLRLSRVFMHLCMQRIEIEPLLKRRPKSGPKSRIVCKIYSYVQLK